MSAIDVSGLSIEQRLQLLDEIGESLFTSPQAVALLDSQREELDRRIAIMDREGPAGSSWEEVEARICGRLQSCT